jgi:CheY-like chemotaxis protein
MLSILIVDDCAAMRRAIRLVVSELADRVYECEDGSEALAAYAAHQPDWVLMDIRMKKTDGLAATGLLKASFPEARIAIVTVCKGDDLREAARLAGACAYVMKDNLLELRKVLQFDRFARPKVSVLARRQV